MHNTEVIPWILLVAVVCINAWLLKVAIHWFKRYIDLGRELDSKK